MSTINAETRKEKKLIQDLKKINPNAIIKEALSTFLKKEKNENSKETNYNMKISEQLNRIKEKAMKDYLESIGHKKLKELKEGIGDEMDKYNKNISSLLIKSNTELKESEKKNTNLNNQIIDLENKINILQKHKNELIINIKDLEIYLENLEKKYSMLMNEKKIFEEIKNIYPGLSLSEMITEISMAKKGSITMLESYSDKTRELLDIKKSLKDSSIRYQNKINKLQEEIREISLAQKEEKEMYEKKINELNNKIDLYETRIKENDYLRNTLYYLYNILFEKMDLLKDITIDKKFIDAVNEKDFTPNILYEPELVAYIELIIKRMSTYSYDKLFRESLGYLNCIVRNYFPENTKLKFKPVEIFKEITNLIEQKNKLINEYKNSIKYKDMQINGIQSDNNKLKEKYDSLSKEYNSYKILVEKSIKFTKNNYNTISTTNNKERVYKTISNTNFKNFNKNSKAIKKHKKGIYLKDYKFSFDIEQYNNPENKSKELSRNDNRKSALSSFKGNSILYQYYTKNKSEKNFKTININNDLNNSPNNIWTYRIEKSENDKLKKENGNQKNINNLNAVSELIDETNRLFLYRTRMTSFQKKIKNFGLEQVNTHIKKREISKNVKEKILQANSIKAFEGKILKKLDNLIDSAKVK